MDLAWVDTGGGVPDDLAGVMARVMAYVAAWWRRAVLVVFSSFFKNPSLGLQGSQGPGRGWGVMGEKSSCFQTGTLIFKAPRRRDSPGPQGQPEGGSRIDIGSGANSTCEVVDESARRFGHRLPNRRDAMRAGNKREILGGKCLHPSSRFCGSLK